MPGSSNQNPQVGSVSGEMALGMGVGTENKAMEDFNESVFEDSNAVRYWFQVYVLGNVCSGNFPSGIRPVATRAQSLKAGWKPHYPQTGATCLGSIMFWSLAAGSWPLAQHPADIFYLPGSWTNCLFSCLPPSISSTWVLRFLSLGDPTTRFFWVFPNSSPLPHSTLQTLGDHRNF